MPKKLTINFVKKEFEKENYVLLDDTYINNTKKLKYICPKGHNHSISWGAWKAGARCYYCFGNVKPSIEFVKSEFKKEGYILLSTDYRNAHQKLNYVCSNNHEHKITWKLWRRGARCAYCSKRVKYRLDDIRKTFEADGYTLLTNVYKDVFAKLKYVCDKGHVGYVTWHNWKKNGARCIKCKCEKMLGEGNPNWKGGISCEPYCYEWFFKEFKEYIKERDGNRCLNPDCWGNIHRLSVHHIDYNKKNCGPENLITLCASCNSRANKDREWHEAWYSVILQRRYNYQETTNEK